MKKLLLVVAAAFILMVGSMLESCQEVNVKESDQTDQRVEELLSKMTLEEKVGQTVQLTSRWEMTGPPPAGNDMQQQLEEIKAGRVGSMLNVTGANATRAAQKMVLENSRLKIPMIFGYDVIHGYQTMFPVPLAIAASWEPELAALSSVVAAREATAAGINWTFAPMVDVSHDARWGRVMEGAGEDPYLASQMGAAYVHGFQGDNLANKETMAACAKHYAAYGFANGGRDYNSVDIGTNTLFNHVLPSFKACSDAGAATFMNSFNTINGVPATGSSFLLRDILKGKWGFEGFVVSDWASISEMIDHGYAADHRDAAEKAIKAGSDMDMEGNCYAPYLAELVKSGAVSEDILDDAVRRILKVKFELGLFDDPYKYCDSLREQNELLSQENLEAARKVARRSFVLLKNENQILPLSKNDPKIALIGALASDKDSPLGSWRARAIKNSAVSVLEGMQAAMGKENKLSIAKGPEYVTNDPNFHSELEFNNSDYSGMDEAVALAKKSNVVVMVLGENCFQTAEGRSQADIGLKGLQMDLFRAVHQVNKNIVVLLMNGRPVAIPELDEKAMAILEVWHPGSMAGHAVADVLFGDYHPSGKLTMSFPRSTGQCPIHYDHLSTGRSQNKYKTVFWSHYTDESNDPLYPFGFGLSYTDFEYANLQLDSKEMKADASVRLKVDIKNTGERDGEEVVQMYIRDVYASIAQPVKKLKAFRKVFLKAGELKTIEFEITSSELSFYNSDYEPTLEAGEFVVYVGGNSRDCLKADFVVK